MGSKGCEDAVRNSWDEEERDGDMEILFERIQLCARNLGEWSKRDFGEITNLLQEKKKSYISLERNPELRTLSNKKLT